MNTQKEKENQLAVRRQTLLASQDVLSKEIDEVIKMLDPIGIDDFPFKGTPLENNPSEWGITELYTPPDHDLSLGYSYKINTGMDSDEAEVLYRELQEKINQKVSTFPDNYSLSDGLLYLGHPQEELTTS